MRFVEISKPLITEVYYKIGGPLPSGVSLPGRLYEAKEGKNTHLE